MIETSHKNLETLTKNVYQSCQVADEVLNSLLWKKYKEALSKISQNGNINLSSEKVEWQIINQFTKQQSTTILPKLNLGNTWFGQNKSFSVYQPIVDDLAEKNYTITIFQRINEQGDMLRVATNVKLDNNDRAIGTFIPAFNQDGSKSSIISNILNSEPFQGNAFVVNDYYQSLYQPLKDKNGYVIGMIYTGVSLNAASQLRESILNTVVGKSGYVYVLGGSGLRKGYYIISKNGERDNEKILDVKDANNELIIQKIINQAVNNTEGDVSFIEYSWKNSGDIEAKPKIVGITYFKPFDWVIGAGTNLEEIEESSTIVKTGFQDIFMYVALTSLIALIVVIIISTIVSRKISYPITKSALIMKDISEGKITNALQEIDLLEGWYKNK
jgi:methyl-accepting chemotaxis protein